MFPSNLLSLTLNHFQHDPPQSVSNFARCQKHDIKFPLQSKYNYQIGQTSMRKGQTCRDRQERGPKNDEKLREEKWKNFYERVKKNMNGSEEEKETILRKRMLKYFHDYRLETDLFYIKRRDISSSSIDLSLISVTSLFLYGIDFLSESRIKQYFEPFQVEVSIYDDSHCQVGFHSSSQLMEAYYSKLIERPCNLEQFYSIFKANHGEMIQWRELIGYSEMTVERKLWGRFITKYDFDQKREVSSRASMEAYETAKGQFLNKQEKIVPKERRQPPSYGFRDMLQKKKTIDRGETPKKTSCCSERMNKLLDIIDCSCSHRQKGHDKRSPRRRESSYEVSERQRTREKKKKSIKATKIELFLTSEIRKPLPLIEEITKSSRSETTHFNKPNKLNEIDSEVQLSQIQAIEKNQEQEHSQDNLLEAMLQEFQKYKPFEKTEDQKQSININNSRSLLSFFECGSDGEEG